MLSKVFKCFMLISFSKRQEMLTTVDIKSEGSKSPTHYLSDTNRFDVSSGKGPSSGIIPTKGLCSKRRICLYRLGSE